MSSMPDRKLPAQKEGALAGLHGLVVGAGPLGLASALALAQNGAKITLRHPHPLGHGVGFENAAGLIEPVATEDQRAERWTSDTDEFCRWAADDDVWGVEQRRVLLLSDDPSAVRGGWLDCLEAVPAPDSDLVGGRAFGCWFQSHVIQPDLALQAIQRELSALGISRDSGTHEKGELWWVREVAELADQRGADFFVLAPGISIAKFRDIHQLVGEAAGISAGLGMTIEFDPGLFEPRLDYVVMDQDELGYLIPQRTRVIAGGTNLNAAHNDPLVASRHPMLDIDLEAEVRNKLELIHPHAADFEGKVKIGARPMRREVLTHWTEAFHTKGLILGGAGGSGWTFSVGIAHDVCRAISRRFRGGGELTSLGNGHPL
jgi:glycine/D-amino acid oxidase-like deaminating enzyme